MRSIEEILIEAWKHGYSSNRKDNHYINDYRNQLIEKLKNELEINIKHIIRDEKIDFITNDRHI